MRVFYAKPKFKSAKYFQIMMNKQKLRKTTLRTIQIFNIIKNKI